MSILLYIYFSLLNVSEIIGVFTLLFAVPYIVGTIWAHDDEGTHLKPLHRTVTKVYLFFIFLSIFLASMPNIKQMSMIFGIPAAMELSKNPDVQKIPQNILNIVNQELEEKVKKNHENREEK